MDDETIELDILHYSSALSLKLQSALKDSWNEQKWQQSRQKHIEEWRQSIKKRRRLNKILNNDLFELSFLFVGFAVFGLLVLSIVSHFYPNNAGFWEEGFSCRESSEEALLSFVLYGSAIAGIFYASDRIKSHVRAQKRVLRRLDVSNPSKSNSNHEAYFAAEKAFLAERKKAFLNEAQESPPNSYVVEFCLEHADEVIDEYIAELRAKDKEANAFLQRQRVYQDEIAQTFEEGSARSREVTSLIQARIAEVERKRSELSSLIKQGLRFRRSLKEKADELSVQMKQYKKQQELMAKIQKDSTEKILGEDWSQDQQMMLSFQALESFLSDSSDFIEAKQELDEMSSPV